MEEEILCGIMVPDWYLDMEKNLLESMLQLSEAKKSYRTARNRLVGAMNKNNIKRVDSNLATVFIYPPTPGHGNGKRLRVILKK